MPNNVQSTPALPTLFWMTKDLMYVFYKGFRWLPTYACFGHGRGEDGGLCDMPFSDAGTREIYPPM